MITNKKKNNNEVIRCVRMEEKYLSVRISGFVCACVSLLMVYANAYRGFLSCSLFAIDMKGNVEANGDMKEVPKMYPFLVCLFMVQSKCFLFL